MTQLLLTLSELRAGLKSAQRVQFTLNELYDSLLKAGRELRSQDAGALGVQIGLEVVSSAKAFLIEQLDVLNDQLEEVHKKLTESMRAEDEQE